MRILYGLCGEGSGHATRSAVVIRRLVELGHEVLAAAPKEVSTIVERAGARTTEIVGLRMACSDGAMDLRATLERNAKQAPEMMFRNAGAWDAARSFAPQACITDYDSFAWLFASASDVPVVSIDNAQILPRCEHDPKLFGRFADGMGALSAFTRMIAPTCHHYVVTSFFYPRVREDLVRTTTLVPPILRREVLDALADEAPGDRLQATGREPAPLPDACSLKPEASPVLVYKTASLDDESMLRSLSDVEASFVVYGVSVDATMPENCARRPFDEAGFVRDLASCRAVVCNAGMSLTGEALAFGKPVFAVPVRDQFEQVLNALYLDHLGYGFMAETLEARALASFLKQAERFERRLRERPTHDGNARLYDALERLFGRG